MKLIIKQIQHGLLYDILKTKRNDTKCKTQITGIMHNQRSI